MATEKIGIEVEVKGAEKSISSFKDLKTAIKAAKDEQIAMTSKFGEGSIEATKAGQKLAGLQDKVGDLNDATKSLTGSGIEKLTSSFRLLGEGIATFDFDKIKTGFGGIGAAMSAIPIFFIIKALEYLYNNFDKIITVVENLIPGFKSVSKFIGGIVTSITDFIGITSDATRAVDALRESADKQLAVNKKYLQEHGDQVNKYTAQKIDAKNRYLEAIKEDGANVAALGQRLNRELANIDKQRLDDSKKVNGKSLEDSKKTNDDKIKAAKEAAKEKLLIELELQGRLKELQTELIYDEQEKEEKILANKYEAERKSLVSKGANIETLKALDDLYLKQKGDILDKYLQIEDNKAINIINKTKEINANLIEDEEQKALKILEIKNKLDRDALLNTLQRNEETNVLTEESNNLLIAFDEQYLKQKGNIEDEFRKIKKAKEKQLQQDIVDSVNLAAQTTLSVQKTLSDTYYLKETQKINKLYKDKLKNVVQGSKEEKAILEQKAKEEKDLARQQFETQKKFNRASAILNGILGIGAILAVPDPTLGILSAIRIGALAITTAANIASINATQFDEGGGSAGAIPAAETSAPSTAEAPAIYGPGQGQSTTFSGNQNNSFAPVKAYVVETENRSTTNRVNKLVSESTYG